MSARILIVDDDRVILELASIILRTDGYSVRTAGDGILALNLLAEESFDLVLLDFMMPGKDGLEVLQEIKHNFPDIAVIIFTGMGSENIAVNAMKAGAADYIIKPFRNHDLLERTATVLRSRRLEMQNRELLAEREHHLQEIQQWNLKLERRVAEKSQELDAAQDEIIQAEKLATLGHLAVGLTHEIRNPLNSINLFAQILKNDHAAAPQSVEFLDRIQSEIDRIDNLLIKLLAVSRAQNRVDSVVQVDIVAKDVLKSFQPQLEAQRIRLQEQIVATPLFHGDQEEVRQIFTNLISNALHSMPEGGELSVSVVPILNSIQVKVSDTGCGIPLEDQARVFDPFFTTRKKGTGFGLSSVLRIIKTYKGKISLSSQPGQGTTFNVLLPLQMPVPVSVQETPS
ncbi:MAG: response regulator [Desulfuromonadales bacterium]|nr:response regulator [Desulfuromonadales bacterium]